MCEAIPKKEINVLMCSIFKKKRIKFLAKKKKRIKLFNFIINNLKENIETLLSVKEEKERD